MKLDPLLRLTCDFDCLLRDRYLAAPAVHRGAEAVQAWAHDITALDAKKVRRITVASTELEGRCLAHWAVVEVGSVRLDVDDDGALATKSKRRSQCERHREGPTRHEVDDSVLRLMTARPDEDEDSTLAHPKQPLVPRREPRAPSLRITDTTRTWDVSVDATGTLGTAEGATFRVVDPTVSRLHLRFAYRDEGLWVHDLGSTNGTFVGDLRIGSALLPEGAVVRVGSTRVEVHYGRAKSTVVLWPAERFGQLVGRSHTSRELFGRIARVAPTDATVLIQGETGTGKEVVARTLHEASARKAGPFVVVDCSAIPEALFESELFGHAKGAFTGASAAHRGAFLAADKGTLFLDEVGELPLADQAKLLRALESRTVKRVGETQHQPVDVRIVTATHRDLARMVTQGAFREDLYFRLAVVPLVVPALRERAEDVPLLLTHFARGADLGLSPAEVSELSLRAWPGNVRELRNFVERLLALGPADALAAPAYGVTKAVPSEFPPVPLDEPFKDVRDRWLAHLEREFVRGWMERTGGRTTEIADRIGLDRTYVYRLIKKHGLER